MMLVAAAALFAAVEATPFVRPPATSLDPAAAGPTWVFFTDKGFRTETELHQRLDQGGFTASEPARRRRERATGAQFDYYDMPVASRYLDLLARAGIRVRHVSRWLNAASVELAPGQADLLERLGIVAGLAPVATFRAPAEAGALRVAPLGKPDTTTLKGFYGNTYVQNEMLGIPAAYFQGFNGSGVRIGVLDTGLKRRHAALLNLDVVAEYDFISGDRLLTAPIDDRTRVDTIAANIPLAADQFLVAGSAGRLFAFFCGDTVRVTLPSRELFWSVSADSGRTWQPRAALTLDEPELAHARPQAWGGDQLCLVYEASTPSRLYSRIMASVFDTVTSTWRTAAAAAYGHSPSLAGRADSLFLVFAPTDSTLAYALGQAAPTGISWGDARLIATGTGWVTTPWAVWDSTGIQHAFWTEIRSGQLLHAAEPSFTPEVIRTAGSGPCQALATVQALHVFAKDYGGASGVGIVYLRRSGTAWQSISLVTNLPDVGELAAYAEGTNLRLVYESEGAVWEFVSGDEGRTWPTAANRLVDGDFAYAPRTLGNRLFWTARGDDNTGYDPAQDDFKQPNHGTRVVSVIGGYQPPAFVGAAPGASFIIAKTERNVVNEFRSEFAVEEDSWVEGLEWAERQGADVVTSSLGYADWYRWQDMDGKTSPASRAAHIASTRGLVVCNAIGNRQLQQSPYIVAPGDADGVVTVGGVNDDSTFWLGAGPTDYCSGLGPTADGRMKPELVAQATGVFVVDPDSQLFWGYPGTSFATPLIAGACALLKETHPTWTADSIKLALFASGSNVAHPNDTLGYGIPNVDSVLHRFPARIPSFEHDELGTPFPSPFVLSGSAPGTVCFPFRLLRASRVTVKVFTLDGRLLWEHHPNRTYVPGRYRDRAFLEQEGFVWNGRNAGGEKVAAGIYLVVLQTGFARNARKLAVVR